MSMRYIESNRFAMGTNARLPPITKTLVTRCMTGKESFVQPESYCGPRSIRFDIELRPRVKTVSSSTTEVEVRRPAIAVTNFHAEVTEADRCQCHERPMPEKKDHRGEMSMLKNNSIKDSVNERRLRPIYELLDTGNNKKVIAEADRLLKKQANFSCVKVLKALALLRLGKKADSVYYLDQVFEEEPTDESTIQAMSICYREMDKPDLVCRLLDNACRKDKSEELLTFCFMSHVRVMNFPKQHQTAVSLYKSYPKAAYMMWAIMSLFVKAKSEADEVAQRLTLPLAERMMVKYMESTTNKSVHELLLYSMILFEMKQFDRTRFLLVKIKDQGHTWLDTMENMLLECYVQMNDDGELFKYFEEVLTRRNHSVTFYSKFIEKFGVCRRDDVQDFMKKGVADLEKPETVRRSALMAQLIHYEYLSERGECTKELAFKESLLSYISKYQAKPFLYCDLKRFLKYVRSEEDIQEVLELASSNVGTLSEDSSNWVAYIQKKIAYHLIAYHLKFKDSLQSPTKVLALVEELLQGYFKCLELWLSKAEELKPKDPLPQDDAVCAAADLLMTTFWKLKGFWAEQSVDHKLKDLTIDKESNFDSKDVSKLNGPLNRSSYSLPDEDFPILICLSLLELGVLRSAHNSSFRLLLNKLYTYCGAFVAGVPELFHMDIKHPQIESLGYLYMSKIFGSGALHNARRLAQHSEAFYVGQNKEVMEYVISAYKYAAWVEVVDFLTFKDNIKKSLQACLLHVEKHFLDYTLGAFSHETTVKVASKDEFNYNFILNETLTEARDISVFKFLINYPYPKEFLEKTHQAEVEKLKVRATTLAAINNLVKAMTKLKDNDEEYMQCMNVAKSAYEELSKLLQNDYALYHDDSFLTLYEGPWPSSVFFYCSSVATSCLCDFIRTAHSIGMDPGNSQIAELISQLSESVKSSVTAYTSGWKGFKFTLKHFANIIEEVFHVVEMLGLYVVLADVIKTFLHYHTYGKKKVKGKKTKEVSESPSNEHVRMLLETLESCLENVEQEIGEFTFAEGNWLPTVKSEVNDLVVTRLPEETVIQQVVCETLPVVSRHLNASYQNNISDIKFNAMLKRKYVSSLMTS